MADSKEERKNAVVSVFFDHLNKYQKNMVRESDTLFSVRIKRLINNPNQIPHEDLAIYLKIAAQIYKKYSTPSRRQVLLNRIFPPEHPFREFSELFGHQRAGNDKGINSLQRIFSKLDENLQQIDNDYLLTYSIPPLSSATSFFEKPLKEEKENDVEPEKEKGEKPSTR